MPGTLRTPAELLASALPLQRTPGQAYVEKRAVPVELADAAGVRFDPDFGGRPAVVVAMRDRSDRLTALHGRYLHANRSQDKMRTIGTPGGVVDVLGGWRADPLILVEGLFDALSLATCGWASVATIGREAPWIADISTGRTVWIAFDSGKPGEAEAARRAGLLPNAETHRLPPPPRCKDWNTALVKLGPAAVSKWIAGHVTASSRAAP
jgi:hypothetical protein